jgi:hypothetical protein
MKTESSVSLEELSKCIECVDIQSLGHFDAPQTELRVDVGYCSGLRCALFIWVEVLCGLKWGFLISLVIVLEIFRWWRFARVCRLIRDCMTLMLSLINVEYNDGEEELKKGM